MAELKEEKEEKDEKKEQRLAGPPLPHPTATNPIPSPATVAAAAPDSLINPVRSLAYWTSTPASTTGMLGGYPQISRTDLHGSRSFLSKLRRRRDGAFTPASHRRLRLGLDCGAGIGRVTDGLLRHVCERVDAVEPVAGFAEALVSASRAAAEGRLGEVEVVGLQDWPIQPPKTAAAGAGEVAVKRYDLIWNQWCLGHLTDQQLVAYLRRCRERVRRGGDGDGDDEGWIVVKENMSTDPEGQDVYDDEESSVTRTDGKFRDLFERAGLEIVRTELQTGFPKGLGLYPVRMYGLRPKR